MEIHGNSMFTTLILVGLVESAMVQANSDLPKTVTCLVISYAELWNNSSCNAMSVDEAQSVSWLQTYVFLVNTVHDNNRYC